MNKPIIIQYGKTIYRIYPTGIEGKSKSFAQVLNKNNGTWEKTNLQKTYILEQKAKIKNPNFKV